MASVLLSPVGNGQQFFDNNGVPLAGGLIYQYQAGSSTPLTTYTTNNGTIANTNPIILDSAGRLSNEIWMQTGYTYKLVIQTSAGVTLQTLDNLYPILQNSTATGTVIPAGLISIWSGAVGSVPSGWLLCDGSNGTPDLRNSFIVGAGSTYSVNQTGGSADAITVTHTHTATVTDAGHQHFLANTDTGSSSASPTLGATNYMTYRMGGGGLYEAYSLGGSATTPTVGLSQNKVTGVTVANSNTGSSGTNANLPPYYALAYIMKT